MGIQKTIPHPFSVECYVERFDGKYAILKNGEAEMGAIRWPIHKLPENIQIDEKVTLRMTGAGIADDREYLAKKKLLEEIIN